MSGTAFNIIVAHDADDSVWHVVDSDVPGLAAEADSYDELVAIIADVVPELIAANLPGGQPEGVPMNVTQRLVLHPDAA